MITGESLSELLLYLMKNLVKITNTRGFIIDICFLMTLYFWKELIEYLVYFCFKLIQSKKLKIKFV